MKQRRFCIALIGTAMLAVPPVAAKKPVTGPVGQEASIPFVAHGGIRNFHVADDYTVFLEGHGRQWYKAELSGYCQGLSFATALGFDTGPIDRLDRFSRILTRDDVCPLSRLTYAESPIKAKPKPARARG